MGGGSGVGRFDGDMSSVTVGWSAVVLWGGRRERVVHALRLLGLVGVDGGGGIAVPVISSLSMASWSDAGLFSIVLKDVFLGLLRLLPIVLLVVRPLMTALIASFQSALRS